ncbi:hypothetical protein BC834DRAFT_834218 [Gloeopeniophorella convolvens]|nr:hypothetical protein BC834DRAFT_834218 [Gloeopeniophorella convolvens]
MQEWKDASKYLATWEYQKALSKLEGLVVARLFELHKIGLSGTGYKMRTHINKSLKTRCKAIQRALRKYNDLASQLGRPQLEWQDISTYGSLAEFELLQECREDVRQKPWANSANRQAALHSLKVERAREEQKRLNIEIARLVDWMAQDERAHREAISRLCQSESLLWLELEDILARRMHQNDIHRERIRRIYRLQHYTGVRDAAIASGVRSCVEQGPEVATTVKGTIMTGGDVSNAADADANSDDGAPDAEEDDLTGAELHGLDDFIGALDAAS